MDVTISRTRRSSTTEYKVEASYRVIDSGQHGHRGRPGTRVERGSGGRWVADRRRRIEAAAGDDEPLTRAERSELARLCKQVAEQAKDIAFLKIGLAGIRPALCRVRSRRGGGSLDCRWAVNN